MKEDTPMDFYDFYKLTEDSLNRASEDFSKLLRECGDNTSSSVELVSNPQYEIY